MSKHKFFAWLILHDIINTREMLIRRNWKVTDDHACVLCPSKSLEDWSHLFSNVISVPGYGLICRFIGAQVPGLKCLYTPGNNSRVLALWKLSYWHVGIYGGKGMIKFSKG
jgi:hypothetical protein